jgi:hypothetical protein
MNAFLKGDNFSEEKGSKRGKDEAGAASRGDAICTVLTRGICTRASRV